MKNEDTEFLFSLNKCNVYSLDKRDIYDRKSQASFSREYLKNVTIDCEHIKNDIYISRLNESNKISESIFASACIVDKNHNHSYCKSIFDESGSRR